MNPKLIIFDVDGTIVDAYRAIEQSFDYTMKKLGYPARKPLVIRRAVGWGDEKLLEPFIEKEDLKKAVSIYRAHHKSALLKGARLYPGAKRILGSLRRRKIKLAIASNRPTKFTRILLRHLDIDGYFDYILCADRLQNGKPHPEILLKIMQKLGISSSQTLYVGDMTIDVQAGRNAGVQTAAVLTGSSTKEELARERPYRIYKDVTGLSSIICCRGCTALL